jgi:hypothetical protein
MATLDDVLTELKTVLRTVSELRNLPDEPPAQLNAFPAAIVYPTAGRSRFASSVGAGGQPVLWKYRTVVIDLYVTSSGNLGASLKRARPFADSVPDALMRAYAADRFGGLVTMLGDPDGLGGSWPVRHEAIQTEISGGGTAMGWRFELDIAYTEELTA